MIENDWRAFVYPLGFLASLGFSLRFFIQWLSSERRQRSHVPRAFWIISFFSSFIMTLHGFIQIQYPIAFIQMINAFIAWRNLDLMKSHPKSLRKTILYLTGLLFLLVFACINQSLLLGHGFAWMRAPHTPWNSSSTVIGWEWHLFGFLGITAFASRFWLQWYAAEKKKVSFINPIFWWMSLCGACMSLAYFIRLSDLVNILGYGVGIIPYIRNLMLLKKDSQTILPPANPSKKIFLFAGEQSADLHGKHLLESLKKELKAYDFYGVGGPQMRQAGLQTILTMENFQIMGFTAVFKALPRIYRQFQKIKKTLLQNPPEVVIFIDYPDFNMRLAKALRKKGYQGKLVHYICPSVWAWRKQRIKDLAKTLDLLLMIYPFEEKYFSHTSLTTRYVGHPLSLAIKNYCYNPDWNTSYPFPGDKKCLSIFPGSRPHEIQANLTLQLKTAQLILEKDPEAFYCAISVARNDLVPLITQTIKNFPQLSHLVYMIDSSHTYELMKHSYAALATSGTVTLELALHKVPTVVMYRLSLFNYFISKYFFKINLPHYCIVNIVGGSTIYPEFFCKDIFEKDIFEALIPLCSATKEREQCIEACKKISNLLSNHNENSVSKEVISLIL